MRDHILYLQTKAAKNLLESLAGTISDGYYENGPFYFNPKEDGKKRVKPCNTSYHPACPEGFTPMDISDDLEVKVNEDYRLFGLWSKDKDADLRKYGILDFMDLLAWDRSEGRDKDGCRRWGSLWMVGVIIATEKNLDIDPLKLPAVNNKVLREGVIHDIYAKDVKHWDLKLMDTIREINEALMTSNLFSKDPEYGRLTHWKYYLMGGECRLCSQWQKSYTSWDMNETSIYEDWMLEKPYIEKR